MSLFQNSVLNKYLKGLEKEKVDSAWAKFTAHFHNPTIQENIRNSKEEQYQGEFLIDLFVKVLGYTKNPNPDFNLTTELKNVKGAKKTDGAILLKGKALAVIELKGTNTTDLNKIETQAFGYKNNQPDCVYVITSNFEKLRFYIDNAVDFEDFNLFELTRERFDLLWLCLSADYLLNNKPKQIKNESVTREEEVTGKLYKDYSAFRNELFTSINQSNPQYDKLTLFKKTQKLLDRFLFIFFAEDRLLLPPNSIRQILKQWTELREIYDEDFALYDRFKKYFGYMNTGHKGKKHDIFAYNGGLFEPDAILDNIAIDDDLLYKHTLNLSDYDFESEVSVNILGHIFENSLSEIEEIQAELAGEEIDKKKGKRKKDGVFYTPKYITKYIVDNTVGKLCEEKKAEIGIDEAEYEKNRKGRKKATLKALKKQLDDYRDWLLQLTICDPACGSGAFLNQALEFLIAEHSYLDELETKLLGGSFVFPNIENTILENNLYGVDINEESVEIAKLSLWLRTAQKGRKLTSLNNNIKCGNSLIDDPAVAGEKAFKWEAEFLEVFEKGGFDVVIGNPPYKMVEDKSMKGYYSKIYSTLEGRFDLFEIFIEKSLELFTKNGKLSFIIPNTILSNLYAKKLRIYILNNFNLVEIVNFGMDVFSDPSVHTCIITISNFKDASKKVAIKKQVNREIELQLDYDYSINKEDIANNKNFTLDIFFNPSERKLFDKVEANKTLGSICYIRQCIKTGNDKIYVKKSENHPLNPWKKSLRGKGIQRYTTIETDLYIKYGDWLARNWKNKTFYETPKIGIRETGNRITATLDVDNRYFLSSLYSIYPRKDNYSINYLKSILAILNSSFATFYIKKIAFELTKGAFTKVRTNQLARLPIPELESSSYLFFSQIVDSMLQKHESLNEVVFRLNRLFQRKFSIEKPSKKLQSWHELTFAEFEFYVKSK